MSIYVTYSAITGRVRSWIVGENVRPRVGKGEAVIEVQSKDYGDLYKLQALVTQATGLIPADDRYIIVNAADKIVGTVIADPVGCDDVIPDHVLVKHAEAGPTWEVKDDGSGGKLYTPPYVDKDAPPLVQDPK